jgi:sporulation protein YlmC with PRC-barrel domain
MRMELTSLYGLDVYTDKGTRVGRIDDVVIDTNEKKILGLAVGNINTDIFDVGSKGAIIPYRWVVAIGDIILIREIRKKEKK